MPNGESPISLPKAPEQKVPKLWAGARPETEILVGILVPVSCARGLGCIAVPAQLAGFNHTVNAS